ncbi:MAG: GTP pyrophosphokinase family protein, partial [Holdemanella sp.]|nr:GTP pyrophosphokinase family protein [Holdemanella sp.]
MIKETIKNIPYQFFTKEEFINLIEKNTKPYKRLMTFYKCAIMEVETKFNVLNEELSLDGETNPIESIKTRIKSTESLARKMNKRKITPTIENIEQNIFDVAGVRVICSFPEDIYRIEQAFLSQDDITLIERKDYIEV